MTIRPTRQMLAGALCIAAGLAAALGPGDKPVHAAMTVSADPVVALSNGLAYLIEKSGATPL